MKDLFTKNIGLKLLSLLLALLLWLTVMNIEDPTITGLVENIPVQIINEEVVTSRGYGYTVESGEKVDVKVKGRRSIVDNLTPEDFTATADFNSFNAMYMAPISVTCNLMQADELTVTPKNEQMAVKLEDQATEAINVRVILNGNVKDGYYLFGSSANTVLVSATGSASQVAEVKEVIAEVDIEGVMSSFETEAVLYAVNSNGERIDSKKISLSQDSVKVSVTICQIKDITVDLVTQGDPADYYYVDKVEFAPQQVLVAADAELLSRLDVLSVPFNITGATDDIEGQVDLGNYIEQRYGDRCVPVDRNATMGIHVSIRKMSEKMLEIKQENIELRGTDSEKYEYLLPHYMNSSVIVRGREEELANIETSDLHLWLDCTELEAGEHVLDLCADYNGKLLTEFVNGGISVAIIKKTATTGTEPVKQTGEAQPQANNQD